MKIAIYVSSLTGNTRKLAEYLYQGLQEEGHELMLIPSTQKTEIIHADRMIIAFWCRRSSMDDKSLHILSKCKGEKIIAVGTIGGKAYDTYGERVENTVAKLIAEHNHCLGVYACQGMIDPARTEKRRALAKDDPHYLDDEGYARHLANRGRPNEEDMMQTLTYVKACMEKTIMMQEDER